MTGQLAVNTSSNYQQYDKRERCDPGREGSILGREIVGQEPGRYLPYKGPEQGLVQPYLRPVEEFAPLRGSSPFNGWNGNSVPEKEVNPGSEWRNYRGNETEWGTSKSAG